GSVHERPSRAEFNMPSALEKAERRSGYHNRRIASTSRHGPSRWNVLLTPNRTYRPSMRQTARTNSSISTSSFAIQIIPRVRSRAECARDEHRQPGHPDQHGRLFPRDDYRVTAAGND